jgi:ferredoxin
MELTINPVACEGVGLCHELLPELIGLDEWGYPVIEDADVPANLGGHARRAVALCPRLAVRLVPGHH